MHSSPAAMRTSPTVRTRRSPNRGRYQLFVALRMRTGPISGAMATAVFSAL
jgi:hypothetical protein